MQIRSSGWDRTGASERKWRGESSLDLTRIYREVPVGLCYLDTDLRYVHINNWLAAINGLSVEEHLGRSIREVLPDVAAVVESQLRHVIETGEPITDGAAEAETPAHPRVKRHYQHDYYPVRSKSGTVLGVSCVVNDVTERKRAEKALRQSEERFNLAAEGSRDGIWFWELPEQEWWSPRFYELLGYQSGEIEASYAVFQELLHPEDKDETLEAVRAHLKDHERYDVEFRLRMKFGDYHWFHSRGQAAWDETDKPVRMAGSIRDITERKQIEADLKQAAHQVQQLHEELAHMGRISTAGEMATGLAHELNQPLTAIAAYAEGCLLNVGPPGEKGDKLVHALEQIKSSAEQAGEIIRRLRNLVRRRAPRRSTVDINESVAQIAKMVESTARLNDVELDLRLTEGLPTVDADSIQIHQVILNLLRNAFEAVKEMPLGKRNVTIWTIPSPDNGVEVVVEDQGEGLSREALDRAFEAFFTTKPDGLGLGLSISKSIIEAHGGRLCSAPGGDHGATFRFSLPGTIGGAR